MAFEDLREFITFLEKHRELKRIKTPVTRDLEIAEITDRVSKRGGPALLFENVEGASMPVLINSLGSQRRMQMALGVESYSEITGRITELLDFKSPQGLIEKIKMIPKLAELGAFFPKKVKSGPCKDVILERGKFSLFEIPILQCWPNDAGRFITFPLVISKNPATGKRNVGIYRMQVYDEQTTAMHWQIHKHGAAHFQDRSKKIERMEVAVAIGADPVTSFSGALPLPDDLDELLFAGFLRQKPVEVVPCETLDLEVPANAEIILEGYVDPGDIRTEGPFGDHTGFYTSAEPYPAFHVTCVTHRENPIYMTTIVGKPPMEDCWMGHAIERIFLPLMQRQYPEIIDIAMPFEGVFHNLMIVSIKKRYPGHARKAMHAIWSLGQAMFTKCIVVVDDDVDPHDLPTVAWRVLNNIDPERDVQMTLGPVDVLDHAARAEGFGSKMGIDGTRKWKAEGHTRDWPEEISMSQAIRSLVDQKWNDYGL